MRCAILGLSIGWLHKLGQGADHRSTAGRRDLDAKVTELFGASGRTYGSPRIHRDLLEAGWPVGENTVAESMRRQGLFGRKPKPSNGSTKQDRAAPTFPDLLRREFTAPAPNVTWCGDIPDIPTDEGKLYLATVIDLSSRWLLACPISEHPNAIRSDGVIFHTDPEYKTFRRLCGRRRVARCSCTRRRCCTEWPLPYPEVG